MSFLKRFSDSDGFGKRPAVVQTDGAQVLPAASAGIFSGEALPADEKLCSALIAHIENKNRKNKPAALVLILISGLFVLSLIVPVVINIFNFISTGNAISVSVSPVGIFTVGAIGALGGYLYISGINSRNRAQKAVQSGNVYFYRYIFVDKILHSYKDSEGDRQEDYYAMLGEFSVKVEWNTPRTRYAVGAVVYAEGKCWFYLLYDMGELAEYCK
ncbi:MAG: hypothetical protein ACI4J4_04775 [Ruminiclostridium sp.]